MFVPLFLIALFAILQIITASVTEVDDTNFENQVFGNPGTYSLVYFNSPYCSYCRQFDPEFEPLGDLYRGTRLNVFKIDGLHNKRIRAKYQLIGFPVVKLFSSDGTQVGFYNGKRRTPEIMDYIFEATGAIANKLPSYVNRLDNYEGNTEDMKLNIFNHQDRDIFVAFFQPWDKKLGNPYNSYFERLAKYYGEKEHEPRTEFYGIDVTDSKSTELMSKFEVGQFPVIFYLPKGRSADEKYTVYKLPENPDSKMIIDILSGKDIGQKPVNLEEMERNIAKVIQKLQIEDITEEEEEEEDDDDDDYAVYRDL